MLDSLPAYKRKSLEDRRVALIEEYEAASMQLNRALTPADRLRLQRQLDNLDRQIQDIDDALAQSPSPKAIAPDYKRKVLENRRAALVEEYKAANMQLDHELSDMERLRLQRQIDELERQVQEIDDELARRPSPKATVPAYKHEAFEKRKAALIEDYKFASVQLNRTLDSKERLRLQRHLDNLDHQIQEIDNVLAQEQTSLQTLEDRRATLVEEYESVCAQLSRAQSDGERVRIQREIEDLERQIWEIDNVLAQEQTSLQDFTQEQGMWQKITVPIYLLIRRIFGRKWADYFFPSSQTKPQNLGLLIEEYKAVSTALSHEVDPRTHIRLQRGLDALERQIQEIDDTWFQDPIRIQALEKRWADLIEVIEAAKVERTHTRREPDRLRLQRELDDLERQIRKVENDLAQSPSSKAATEEQTRLQAEPSSQGDLPERLPNPYVGPRTFSEEEADLFFGREREARDLLSLVISERLVLFYAQSGAGKSSLINTRLRPWLVREGFILLPTGRVGGDSPEGISDVANIFVFNLLLTLDQNLERDPSRFTQMTFTYFLTHLTTASGKHYYYDDTLPVSDGTGNYVEPPHVLIIDQLEELFTNHPERWQDREGFFHQLNQAMIDDPLLWVVLSMREDYIAPLDPYTPYLRGRMRDRFYMQRLEYEAALEAVREPAKLAGCPFASGVAEKLVDDLRQIRVYGWEETQPGQFVEPVQLQTVCYQLWERLQATEQMTDEIMEDILSGYDVDQALTQFYETVIRNVAQETGETERRLRNWVEEQLITEAGTRSTVYRGKLQSGGLTTRAADLLVDRFLLRTEDRAAATWYELVHDRFVEPILRSNKRWISEQIRAT